MTNSIYQTVTDQIIATIEKGEAGSFQMPWHRPQGGLNDIPTNVASGKQYRGTNIIALWVSAMANGYSKSIWGTYKQWAEVGAQVRKGEKSTHVVFWKKIDGKEENEDDNGYMMARAYFVFNADQVDGWAPKEEAAPTVDITTRNEAIECYVSNTGATIRHGEARAYYHTTEDFVNMPARELFTGSKTSGATECYYSTLFHELSHWTGHKARLDRFSISAKSDYAFEELIAELGAAFLCGGLGVSSEARPDHAAYIGTWLKALKNDPKFIFQASSQAQKAVDYLNNLQAEKIAIAA